MKKLLLLLLFSIGSYAQVDRSDFYGKQLITCTVEIDGHETKEQFILKYTLEGIEIYGDKGKQYKLRKCKEIKCNKIHLVEKIEGNIIFSPYLIRNTNCEI